MRLLCAHHYHQVILLIEAKLLLSHLSNVSRSFSTTGPGASSRRRLAWDLRTPLVPFYFFVFSFGALARLILMHCGSRVLVWSERAAPTAGGLLPLSPVTVKRSHSHSHLCWAPRMETESRRTTRFLDWMQVELPLFELSQPIPFDLLHFHLRPCLLRQREGRCDFYIVSSVDQ